MIHKGYFESVRTIKGIATRDSGTYCSINNTTYRIDHTISIPLNKECFFCFGKRGNEEWVLSWVIVP